MPRLRFLFTNAVKFEAWSFFRLCDCFLGSRSYVTKADDGGYLQFPAIHLQSESHVTTSIVFFLNRVNVLFLRIYCLVEDGEAEVALPLWKRETSSFIATLSATLR